MQGPTLSTGPFGGTKTYMFGPEYEPRDFQVMQSLIDDACLRGVAAVRFIHDECVTVTITKGA